MSGSVTAQYGTTPTFTLTCRDNDTLDPFEPDTSVTFTVRRPSGSTSTYDDGDAEVSNPSTGIYTLSPYINAWGNWYVRAEFLHGDLRGSDEWRVHVPRPMAVATTGIYAKRVPVERILRVGDRRNDDEAEISGDIRMRKNETLVWLVDFTRTGLAYDDLVDGASAPVVGGAQAANCTINATEGTGWGIDPDGGGLLIRVAIGSGAATTDEIYVDVSVQTEASDPYTIRIPVEILA